MKLYYSKGACSLAVRILINELGLDAEYESVDLQTKKTESGNDFLKINPKGAVPALEIKNGTILTENSVTQQYLTDNAGSKLPPNVADFKRYRVLEWLNYVSSDLHKNAGVFFSPAIPQQVKDDLYLPQLKAKLDFLNNHLANHQFLMGDDFTLPDAYLFVVLGWLKYFNISLNDWQHLVRHSNDVKHRPAVMQSLKEEGIGATAESH